MTYLKIRKARDERQGLVNEIRGEKATKRLNVNIPTKLYNDFNTLVTKRGLTLTHVITYLVIDYVANGRRSK
jgi:hypothetical protein